MGETERLQNVYLASTQQMVPQLPGVHGILEALIQELEVNCIVRRRIKRLGGCVGSSLTTLSFSQSEFIPLAGIRANVS